MSCSRAYDVFERDRERIWRVRPNLAIDASELSLGPSRAWSVHTDRDGRRARTREATTPGAARVVALGDSCTFGWGVDDDEPWPAALGVERPDREIVNLGVPGYSIAQGTLALDDVALGRDDTVVVGFGANDGHMTPLSDEIVLARRASWLGRAAYPLSRSRLLIATQDLLFPAQTDAALAQWREGCTTPRVDAVRFEALLRALGTRAREARGTMIILDVCARDEYGAAMTRVATSGGYALVRYREVDGSTVDGCHPTPEGHARLAHAIADAL